MVKLRSTLLSAAALAIALGGSAMGATLPGQAAKGPGGADYAIASVIKKAYGFGSAQGIVFRPADPPGAFVKARPVVVLVHGWGAVSPKWYGAWIEHLVRRGNIVVYPRYQEAGGGTAYNEVTGEAVKGIRTALDALAATPGVTADLTKVAYIGHNAGAIIAANLAARAATDGLPVPRAVLALMPTRVPTDTKTRAVALTDLTGLDPSVNMITVTGDRDTVSGEAGARAILRASAVALKADHRLLIRINSDNHGQPPLVAAHYSAAAPDDAYDLARIEDAMKTPPPEAPVVHRDKAAERAAREEARRKASERWWLARQEQQDMQLMEMQKVDAFDHYGVWRTVDIALERTLAGGDAQSVRRDPRIYDMGLWTDGWPIKRLTVESPREAPPATGGIASPQP